MRFSGGSWTPERLVPAFVLPYATWTIYVHAIVAARADFTTLLRGLPFVAAIAVAATLGWFRLRDPSPAPATLPAIAASTVPDDVRPRRLRLAVLALATLWVALFAAGLPYRAFWWGALLATGAAWARHLRAGARTPRPVATASGPGWILPGVAAAAVTVVLVANRPALDDAFYLSIPATLLRLPDQPVLLHDTMYRLADAPLLLPFYRLGNYDVLIAAVARATGIDHLVVAYFVVPSLFAVIAVLAWASLLRRVVPERWPVVLAILFACVMALGERPRAYGNFAFVRMFHGKAVLATCFVPAIAAAALSYARDGGLRRWLLLCAAQIAALGATASALFVAPATAALALAGGWSPGLAHSRRFVLGLLPAVYLLGTAWLVGSGTPAAHALAAPASHAMPGVPHILAATWGPWSTRILLVALLAAWAFVPDPARARYFSAGAFFFLLVALDPYTIPFVAGHSVGTATYWRLTWALPLPFFLAVLLDGAIALALAARSKVLAAGACVALAAASVAFAARSGTLLCTNSVTLGMPALKVPPLEYGAARWLATRVPESGTVLAPEAVSIWLPSFVVHPRLVGVRHMYLSLAFPPAETARRSNLMRYVEGRYRPPGAERWFADAIGRYGLSAVAFEHAIPWAGEIETVLGARGWRPVACGRYRIFVRAGIRDVPAVACCPAGVAPTRP